MTVPFLGQAASAFAERIDALFVAMTLLTGIVTLAIVAVIAAFACRYRRGAVVDRTRLPEPQMQRVQRRLEIAWIGVPLVLFVATFAWAATLYFEHAVPPPGALTISVVAKQWMWKLQHPDGQREINEMHVPVGIPVRLVMTSQDVIHSLYLPAFRIKQDVLPGRYTEQWFTATRTGTFDLFCAEYCGGDHSRMLGRVVVLPATEFERWQAAGSLEPSMAARGEALFRQFGCSGCHGANATVHAPSLAGIFGRPVPLADGTTTIADERYLRDAILLPSREVAAGYAPIMPSFAGQISEEEILDLIAYIKSPGAAAAGTR